jgi:anti-repressor protein
MNSLIIITTNEKGSQVVSARELHEFLEVNAKFADWIKRMLDYGFNENEDYSIILKNEKNSVGRSTKEYAITLDMAKELSMIQRSEKGKQARKYFIESEKQLKAIQEDRFSIPQTFADALRLAVDLEEQKQRLSDKNLMLNAAIEEQKPKVDFAETLMNDTNTVRKVSQVAKELSNHSNIKIGQKTLYIYMRSIELVFKGSTEPTQKAINKGILVLKENQIKNKYGTVLIKPQTLVTPKGVDYLLRKLKKDMSNGQFNMFN